MRKRVIGAIWLGVAAGAVAAWGAGAAKLDAQQQIAQALNRLTWGVAPGDVAAVQKIGLKKWIDLQLHPERIAENPALEAALAPLDTLRMTPAELVEHYPPPQAIQAMAEGKQPLPDNPELRPVVDAEIRVYEARLSSKDAPGAPDPKLARAQQVVAAEPVAENAPPLSALLTDEQVEDLTTGNPRQRVAALEALPEATRAAALRSLPRNIAQQIAAWMPLDQQRRMAYYLTPQQVVPNDLLGAKILRAVDTNRQIEDVLADFWFNHFNVYIDKGQDRYLTTAYEQTAIRPYVLGKFSDLLLATARSPAMLFYLDNWQSVDPGLDARRREPQNPKTNPKAAPRGLNENYGREVMELHTLGVDGGYTQQDVTEVARCFTGWTIKQPQRDPEFFYNDQLHDHGAKVVLGVAIPAGGGESDGLRVIDILSHSPATARHISFELAQRFVADQPPPALVDRMAAVFLSSDGDLRQVMRAMIDSPEFDSPAYYRDKVKSPLEMVVSATRALGAEVTNPTRLDQVIAQMGQPLYAKEPPTGYENTGESWVSSSGLIARLNFAMQLTAGQVPGVQVDLSPFAVGEATLPQVEQNVFQSLLSGQVSAGTRATIERVMAGTGAAPAPAMTPAMAVQAGGANPQPLAPAQIQRLAGLVLGSPDFQKR